MAVTDAYATSAEYRAVTGKTDTSDDSDILKDLTAISRYLDGKLERFFTKDAEDVSRIYILDHASDELLTDDLVSVSAIAIDSDTDDTYETSVTNYELLPRNADKGPEPRPYTKIRLLNSSFPANVRIQVTGVFGWPDVPEAIQRATIHLTAILRIESPRATRRISELGDVMEASPDAMSIIRQLTDRYRRVSYI